MASKVRALVSAGKAAKKKVESAAAIRARELIDLIARRMERITEDFFDMGEALRELEEKRLFVALGFKSLGELLKAHGLMSRSKAFELIHIVKTVPRRQALSLGSEKAYAIARLTAATKQLDTVEEIAKEGVVVRGRKRKVADLSAEEIEKLARKERGKHQKVAPEAREARSAARELQAGLRKKGARTAKVEAEQRHGAWLLVITLPVDQRVALEK